MADSHKGKPQRTLESVEQMLQQQLRRPLTAEERRLLTLAETAKFSPEETRAAEANAGDAETLAGKPEVALDTPLPAERVEAEEDTVAEMGTPQVTKEN